MRGFLIPMAFISSMLFAQQSGWGGNPELALAPPTKEESVTDNYFGTTVRDDYRWLERLDDSKVKAWAAAQNARAQSFLAALPGRTQLAAQVKKLFSSAPPTFGNLQIVGGKIFALKFDPAKQQKFLVLLDSPDNPGSEKSVCDPRSNSEGQVKCCRCTFFGHATPDRAGARPMSGRAM